MSNRHAHFFPSAARSSGDYFLGTPATSAGLGDRVPEDLLHLLLGQACQLDLEHTQFAARHLDVGQRLWLRGF